MRQVSVFVLQLQMAYASVVVVLQAQAGAVIPALGACGLQAEQALVCGHQHTGHKVHLGVQVNLQQRTNVFMASDLRCQCIAPGGGDIHCA